MTALSFFRFGLWRLKIRCAWGLRFTAIDVAGESYARWPLILSACPKTPLEPFDALNAQVESHLGPPGACIKDDMVYILWDLSEHAVMI